MKKLFNKLVFPSPETIIALSSIGGGFLDNLLFEGACKVNIMILMYYMRFNKLWFLPYKRKIPGNKICNFASGLLFPVNVACERLQNEFVIKSFRNKMKNVQEKGIIIDNNTSNIFCIHWKPSRKIRFSSSVNLISLPSIDISLIPNLLPELMWNVLIR